MSGEGSGDEGREPPRVRIAEPPGSPPPPDPEPKEAEPSPIDRLKEAPVTAAIIAINIAVFAWASTTGSTQSNGVLLKFGAVEPLHVWMGQYWRIATCMWMHIGILHLSMNMYFGAGWCALVEKVLGKWRFLAVYLVSGIAGGAVSVLGAWLRGKGHISAGASGAIFGTIGAVFMLRLANLGSVKKLVRDPFFRGTAFRLGIWTLLGVYLQIDNFAHFGGLVFGAASTWLFVKRVSVVKWAAFGAVFLAVVLAAMRPGHEVTREDGCRLYPELCEKMTPGVIDPDPEPAPSSPPP